MDPPAGQLYSFGPFRYDAAQRLLFRDGELVPLVPKAVETLQALLKRRGRVVDKAELMKLVWPDTTVEEVGLARNISLLRKALGDEAEAGTYIETIPKRGYRFIGEVLVTGQQAHVPLAHSARRRPRIWLIAAVALMALGAFIYWQFYMPSRYLPRGSGFAGLAVIPFECLSPEPDCAAFSSSLAELLVVEISKLDAVYVISPSTVRRYQRMRVPVAVMARLLGLPVLVEGTIQKTRERFTISVRLTDVHSGKLIWAESYEPSAGELGQIEAGVARHVAEQIRAHLAAAEQAPRASH